jgi:spore coat protein A, manganese oxidase
MATRRTFLKAGAALSASALFPRFVWAFSQSPTAVSKFTQPLRGLGAAPNIPVAAPISSIPGKYDLYKLDIVESRFSFHPAITGSGLGTKVWGYTPAGADPSYLGGVIVANKGQPVRMRFTNKLPSEHPLPVDDTLAASPSEDHVPGFDLHNRAALHVHGGLLDWSSDGGPFHWFAPAAAGGYYGPSISDPTVPVRNDANGIALAPGQVEVYMPNDQSARFVWYHDHAFGLTRLNAYAGVASAYLITDAQEQWLIKNGILPNTPGYPLGIPLAIQDKTFLTQAAINAGYPLASAKPGDLFYPYQYEIDDGVNPKGRWAWDSSKKTPPTPISAVPEFYSDTAIVNGVAYPYLPVEQRHYRFRVLNGSQARVYNLNLYYESNTKPGEVDTKKAGPAIVQIGTEAGFLDFPALLNSPPQPCQIVLDSAGNWQANSKYNLLLAPGERVDIIVDFSNVPAGSNLILYNDAPAPFPMGDARNDYYTGDPDFSDTGLGTGGAPTTLPGFGPNTRTLMQFRVVARNGAADPPSLSLLEGLARVGAAVGGSQFNALMAPAAAISPASAVKVRNLTLNEDFDSYGRLIQQLGTDVVTDPTAGTFLRDYDSAPTEVIKAGSTEIWRIYNLTGDTHPMHFHLVNVRVLSRRPFTYTIANGKLKPTLGPARPADPNERGLKETVRMNPGEMTEILIKFDLPKKLPFSVPYSPRLQQQYNGLKGYEYVWHCHILEHEEHDMMRPLVIID